MSLRPLSLPFPQTLVECFTCLLRQPVPLECQLFTVPLPSFKELQEWCCKVYIFGCIRVTAKTKGGVSFFFFFSRSCMSFSASRRRDSVNVTGRWNGRTGSSLKTASGTRKPSLPNARGSCLPRKRALFGRAHEYYLSPSSHLTLIPLWYPINASELFIQ